MTREEAEGEYERAYYSFRVFAEDKYGRHPQYADIIRDCREFIIKRLETTGRHPSGPAAIERIIAGNSKYRPEVHSNPRGIMFKT